MKVHVPLENANPSLTDEPILSGPDENALLPIPQLTARSVLGAADPERETMGQLYATQIASAIMTKNSGEKRLVVVGLGLAKIESDRQAFFGIIELVLKCI